MGFFSSLGGVLGSQILGIAQSAIGSQVAARQSSKARKQQMLQAIRTPGIVRAPGISVTGTGGGLIGGQIRRIMGGVASIAQKVVELNADGTVKKKRRRMNVLNYSALKRSLRRLEGFQRTVKRVEKAIPRKPSRRRAQTAAQAHHSR